MTTNILNKLCEFVPDELTLTREEAFDIVSSRKANQMDVALLEKLSKISTMPFIHIDREEAKSILQAILL